MPFGSSTGPHLVSTAVGPTEASAGGLVGLSFANTAAGSAGASGEDNAPSLDHLDDAMSGQEPRLGELGPAGVLMHSPKKDVGAIPSDALGAASYNGAQVAKAALSHNPQLMESSPVFWASGQAEPQEAIHSVEQIDDILSGQQAMSDATKQAGIPTHASSKVVGAQLLDPLSARLTRLDEALYEEAWSIPPQTDDTTGASAAMQSSEQPAPDVFPQSTPPLKRQPSPQPSPTPDLAALLEQEPSPDSLQPRNRSAEPNTAGAMAVQFIPGSQASGSFGGDIGHGNGGYHGGHDDCNAADGNRYCSHDSIIGASYSGVGESDIVSSLGGGAGSGSGGAGSGGAGSHGGSHGGEGAAAENALAPVAPADLGGSSDAGSPAAGSEVVTVKTPGECNGDGSGGAPAEAGAGNIISLTANKLMTGEVSFLDSQLQESTARQGRERGGERGKGEGGGMQAADQDVSGVVSPSAKPEASRFLADLGLELPAKEAVLAAGKASNGVGGVIGWATAEPPLQANHEQLCLGVHVGRRQVNMDCDDPAPDADMEEDEYGDYELKDDSNAAPNSRHDAESPFTPGVAPGLAPAWSAPTAFPAPAATAGSTWLPPGTPSQHAAFGMPHIPFPPPIMYTGYPQMAASGALRLGVVSRLQPAGYPGAESGLWSWEQRELQSKHGKKRKNQGRSEGQKRIKSGASNAQQGIAQQGIAQQGIAQQGIGQQGIAQQGIARQGIAQQGIAQQGIAQQGTAQQGIAQQGMAQPENFVLHRNARLDAVAIQESTAVGTDAAVGASAGGEAKQAAGPAAAAPYAQGKPSASAGTFVSSSYGSSLVQATVLSGYNFFSF